MNATLEEAVALLCDEIERLKMSMETFRLSDHALRRDIMRWHARQIDERHDALAELEAMMAAANPAAAHEKVADIKSGSKVRTERNDESQGSDG